MGNIPTESIHTVKSSLGSIKFKFSSQGEDPSQDLILTRLGGGSESDLDSGLSLVAALG